MKAFIDSYHDYKVPGLDRQRIRQDDLLPLIKKLPAGFKIEEAGRSFEMRPIYGIRTGSGKTRILLWSQMHGDESTATRSLFDLFRFLSANDTFNAIRKMILSELSLFFIPMLNPDGAERWKRENAQHIDINRDARRCITPEGQLIQNLCTEFAPHFAFNLHDQNTYYSAGNSRNPAVFSFLAAPPDHNDTITPARKKALQLIVHLDKKLQLILPDCVGKWNDIYEIRAFGEWFQSKQISTLLIESGGYPRDPERNNVRRLHFGILVEALQSIASGIYEAQPVEPYYNLPLNRENGMFDRMERHAEITVDGKTFIADVGYRENEVITGDLEDFGSFEDVKLEL